MILGPVIDSFKKKNTITADDIRGAFDSQKLIDNYNKYLVAGDTSGLQDFINSMPTEKLKEFFNTFNEGGRTLTNSNQLDSWLANSEASMNTFSKRFSGVGNALKSTLSGIANSFANFGIMAVADFAISGIISLVDNLIHKNEHLIEAGKQAQQAISGTFSEYSNKAQVVSLAAPKYDELSKGVNIYTNQNTSLSTSEYREFLDISNQLANTFPSLVSGYDTQGNALLRLGTGAQSASEQLNTLLTTERRSSNLDISNSLNTNFEGILTQAEELEKQRKAIEDALDNYKPTLSDGSEGISGLPQGHITFDNSLVDQTELQAELEEFLRDSNNQFVNITDFTGADGVTIGKTFDFSIPESLRNQVDAIFKKQEVLLADVTNPISYQLDGYELQLKENWAAMTGSISSFLQTSDSFANLDTSIQNALLTNLQDLSTADISGIQEQYGGDIKAFLYSEYLKPMADLTPEAQDELSKLFSMDPKTMDLDEYSTQITNALEAAFPDNQYLQERYSKNFGLSTFLEKEQDKLNTLSSHLTSVLKDPTASSEQDISSILSDMSIGDREIAYDLVINQGQSFETMDNLLAAIKNVKEQLTAQSNTNNIVDDLTSSLQEAITAQDTLNASMAESSSGKGLSTGSISSIIEMYGDDAEKVFEHTANGIKINYEALRLLRSEEEAATKTKYLEKRKELTDELSAAELRLKDANLTADQRTTEEAFIQGLQEQINQVDLLSTQYDGLTSAYQRWINAQSGGEEGDMYDTMVQGAARAQELYDQGLYGTNEFRGVVDLFSAEDLSLASPEEVKQAWEGIRDKVAELFTEDQNGIDSFTKMLQEKDGKSWATQDENGKWTIDLSDEQEISDWSGLDIETLEALGRKSSDYGYMVNYDTASESLENLTQKAELADEKFKELHEDGSTINFNPTTIDEAEDSLAKAKELYQSFFDETGELRPEFDLSDVENAQAALQVCINKTQELNAPSIMSIDTSSLSNDVSSTIVALQSFQEAYNDLESKKMLSDLGITVDTTAAETALQEAFNTLQTQDPEIIKALKIDVNSVESLKTASRSWMT